MKSSKNTYIVSASSPPNFNFFLQIMSQLVHFCKRNFKSKFKKAIDLRKDEEFPVSTIQICFSLF